MNRLSTIIISFIIVIGLYNVTIVGEDELSIENCHKIVDEILLRAYVDLYAHVDDTFLKTPVVEHVYQGFIPQSFTTEKAKSVLACEIDSFIVEQLKNPTTRLQAPITEALVRGRGPFALKDLLADIIDIKVDHVQGSINVRVEREAVAYAQAKQAYEAYCATIARKLGADYIFEWYQLHHQA